MRSPLFVSHTADAGVYLFLYLDEPCQVDGDAWEKDSSQLRVATVRLAVCVTPSVRGATLM